MKRLTSLFLSLALLSSLLLVSCRAAENGTFPLGDLDLSGGADASDLTALARAVAGIEALSANACEKASDQSFYPLGDFDLSDTVDASDLTALARAVGGIEALSANAVTVPGSLALSRAANAVETLIQPDGKTAISNTVSLTVKNPIYDDVPCPDPELHRFGNEYWIYSTYGDKTLSAFSSSDNMQTWTLHENIMDMPAFSWAKDSIWAPSVMQYNGKYYMAFSANYTASDNKTKYGGIAMAVADNPAGPFEPLTNAPVVKNGWTPCTFNVALIDPHLFVDDDGTVYLYFGNGTCGVCKLSADLKSVVPFADGTTYKQIKLADYCEGPFMIKRNGVYYMMYSCDGFESGKYRVAYAMSSDPVSGFESKGVILGGDGKHVSPGHHSCLYIKEDNLWVICYHRYNNGGARRKGAIDPMYFNEDGTIRPVVMTSGWSSATLDPDAPVSSKNLALSATAFDAGKRACYNGNAKAPSINDNILFSGWQLSGGSLADCWVALDFGKEVSFSSVGLLWENGTRPAEDGFTLQISSDGAVWTDIAGQTAEVYDYGVVPKSPASLAGQVAQRRVTFPSVTARYVRVLVTKSVNSSYAPKLYEMYVYA